jgi:hypothetical protein
MKTFMDGLKKAFSGITFLEVYCFGLLMGTWYSLLLEHNLYVGIFFGFLYVKWCVHLDNKRELEILELKMDVTKLELMEFMQKEQNKNFKALLKG